MDASPRTGASRCAEGEPWRTPEEQRFLLRTVLALAAGARWPLRVFGVDPAAFRELLRTRVLLQQRTSGPGSKVWGPAGAVVAVLMTWFAGLGTGLVALLTEDAALWGLVAQGLGMLMLGTLLFQVLVSILIDPTDLAVVAPHPVTDRTVFAVRLAEVSVYVLVFVAAFTAGAVILPLFALSPLAVLVVYPLLALLGGAVTLGLVTLVFAVCLRIAGPVHFQRVSLWLQIVGGVGLFLVLQLGQLVHRQQWGLWLLDYPWLRALVPPLAYGEILAFAAGARADLPGREVLGAVLLPIGALGVTFWLASRYFVAGVTGALVAPARSAAWEAGLLARLGLRLAQREERAGFGFTLALARREPHVLRAILPQMASFLVLGGVWGFGVSRDLPMFVPMSAALLFVVLPNVLLQTQGSPVPEARALFTSAPLESEDALLRGGVKALLLQWVGVPALGVLALHLAAAGPRVLPRSLLAFELTFACALFLARLFELGVPFTRSVRVGETGVANFGLILLTMVGVTFVVGVHIALCLHPVALWSGIAAFAWPPYFLWRRLGNLRIAPDRRLLVPRTRLVLE